MCTKGESIFCEEPYSCVLLQSSRGLRCDSCFEISDGLKKCTACGILRYCNTKCQRSDWSVHKTECKCLKQVTPKVPLDSVRLMLRLIIKQPDHTELNNSSSIPSSWKRSFSDLQSHVEEIQTDDKRREQFTQIVYTLQQLTHNVLDLPSPDILIQIFGKMVINSFTICDGEMQSIGVGIYLSGSRLDHSCLPNAVITFNGKILNLRTLEQISDISPSTLRISYIDQMALTSERQHQLQQQYYFTCDCPRCNDEDMDGLMLCVKCQSSSCQDGYLEQSSDGTYLPCVICGWSSKDDNFLKETANFQTNFQKTLEKILSMKEAKDDKNVLEVCRTCIDMNVRFTHPYSVRYVQTLDKAFDACINLEEWEKALEYGYKTLTSYRKYYPPVSPNLGVQLMKIGKIQLYLGKLTESLKTLQEAENILIITHGEDQGVYKQLKDLLHQCSEELRVNLEFKDQDS